jgi:hypothetical protein
MVEWLTETTNGRLLYIKSQKEHEMKNAMPSVGQTGPVVEVLLREDNLVPQSNGAFLDNV